MALTPKQIEHIHKLKRDLGIDENLGRQVSQLSRERGHFVGIDPVTPDEGRRIVSETLNPVIERVIEELS